MLNNDNHYVVVGGGPAGVQCALTLYRWGLDVTLVAKTLSDLPDNSSAQSASGVAMKIARGNLSDLRSTNIKVVHDVATTVRLSGSRSFEITVGQETIRATHVIVATGTKFEHLDLSAFEDIERGVDGRIVTEDYETAVRNLFAIGEAAAGYERTLSCAIGTGDGAARMLAERLRIAA